MSVFIVGFTALLGYHATRQFTARGHQVPGVALPPPPADGVMPSEVEIRPANLEELDDAQVEALLKGKDAVAFAAGADDRVVPFARLMTARTFFDPTPSRQALGYGQGGLEEALRTTVDACPPAGRTTFW